MMRAHSRECGCEHAKACVWTTLVSSSLHLVWTESLLFNAVQSRVAGQVSSAGLSSLCPPSHHRNIGIIGTYLCTCSGDSDASPHSCPPSALPTCLEPFILFEGTNNGRMTHIHVGCHGLTHVHYEWMKPINKFIIPQLLQALKPWKQFV